CAATGNNALLDDPRFKTITSRAKHQHELAEILQRSFSQRTAAEWIEDLAGRGIPCGPVNTFADVLDDAHVRETGLIQTLPVHGGETKTIGYPVRFRGASVDTYAAPPELGEHTDDVYARWTA
ncbi:MAG: CoA transferase, partial [Candidatus Eremiobacteraeota bacterium]|nr:CoA transferase [Candidatus Eremiobacteraeota bacterium]